MKTVVLTLLAAAFVSVGAAAATIYLGAYNVAASAPHWHVTYQIMEATRTRSIKAHAAGIVVPAGYDDPARMPPAVVHFSEHCATCHGAPGVERNDLAEGMYPAPPDLTNVSARYTPAQLFWILKNGIKMSGMPAMADDGDPLLWSTVAFLQKLPTMTHAQYADRVAEAQAHLPHDMDMPGMEMGHSPANEAQPPGTRG